MEQLPKPEVQTRDPWQTPTVERHGSLEQLTKAIMGGGPNDGLFSDGPS
jgi:hypothetical protein